MKTIKDIATQLLDERVKLYVKYDTKTAKQYYFMCIFNEDLDFGINLMNEDIEIVIKTLKETDDYILNRIKEVISDKLGYFEDIFFIYFFLFHEEAHWLEFLESCMNSKDYCNSIKLNDYNGELAKLSEEIKNNSDNKALIDSYRWRYRSTPYEKRADAYALEKLVLYLDNK
ncbi:MAG: hypothetical protein JEZ08_05065 [Clostridiales bacterium]|nr:hypothetical protein [Clostridiales bacterium]